MADEHRWCGNYACFKCGKPNDGPAKTKTNKKAADVFASHEEEDARQVPAGGCVPRPPRKLRGGTRDEDDWASVAAWGPC